MTELCYTMRVIPGMSKSYEYLPMMSVLLQLNTYYHGPIGLFRATSHILDQYPDEASSFDSMVNNFGDNSTKDIIEDTLLTSDQRLHEFFSHVNPNGNGTYSYITNDTSSKETHRSLVYAAPRISPINALLKQTQHFRWTKLLDARVVVFPFPSTYHVYSCFHRNNFNFLLNKVHATLEVACGDDFVSCSLGALTDHVHTFLTNLLHGRSWYRIVLRTISHPFAISHLFLRVQLVSVQHSVSPARPEGYLTIRFVNLEDGLDPLIEMLATVEQVSNEMSTTRTIASTLRTSLPQLVNLLPRCLKAIMDPIVDVAVPLFDPVITFMDKFIQMEENVSWYAGLLCDLVPFQILIFCCDNLC